MRIKTISFKDYIQNWELQETSFDKLTLLVGASGVGKSRILQVINILKQIALGRIYRGIEWNVEFITTTHDTYIWSGKTDNSGDISPFGVSNNLFFLLKEDKKAKIEFEEIKFNDKIIISRNTNETIFNEVKMVKFSLNESIISILKEEELIMPISENFKRIQLTDHSSTHPLKAASNISSIKSNQLKKINNISIEDLRSLDLDVIVKLYISSLYCKDIFQTIKERYSEIFPLVLEIQFISKQINFTKETDLNIEIQIKEKGVKNWIKKNDISSGMFRSLIHISEIYLCSEGSVFLIDEFENSLGINCINELTDEIISTDRDVQFIITSHHPYIINNIDFSHWKLVVRNGASVKTNPVSNLINGESSHDKFMQLIQLSQYQTGEDIV